MNFKKGKEKNVSAEEVELKNLEPDDLENKQTEEESDEVVDGVSALEMMQKSNDELKDKLQRTLADFDNFRERTTKEKASMYDDGVRNTVEKLLPIVDNFERALGSVKDKNDSFYKGIEMLLRQFQSVMQDMGVETIEAVNQQFNTTEHNAVAHVQDENFGENEVIEELQKGYKYKGKVVRASMVKVAN